MPKRKKPEKPPMAKAEPRSAEQDLLEKWRRRVSRAKEIRKRWEAEYEVEALEWHFLGRQGMDTARLERRAVFNHFWATIKTSRPNLFYTAPKFFVRPVRKSATPLDERSAAIGESLLDAIAAQEQTLKRAGSLAILQNYFRIGVLKCCFDPRLEPNPQAGEPIWLTNADGEPLVDSLTKTPIRATDPKTGEVLLEPKEVVTDEAYRWEWVDAANVLLPDEGPDQRRWTWIGEEVIVPLDEAKEDLRFSAAWRGRLQANETRLRAGSVRTSPTGTSGEQQLLRYYECYDIQEKRIAIWADGQDFDDFLVEEGLPDGIEDHPYAVLQGWTPILGPEPSPWPMPHVGPWRPIQVEYNIRRQQVTEGAKRSARKMVYDEGTFPDPDQAVRMLQSPLDMEAVLVNDVTKIPVVVPTPEVNPGIYRDIPLLMADWRIITGQTGARMADPDANTATEASFVERAGNLRDADMQDAVNDWLSVAGRKMLQLVQATLTLDMWVKLRGFDDAEFRQYAQRTYGLDPAVLSTYPGLKEIFRERFGQEKWQRITRADLQFEAQVSVVPGSSRPRNLEVERNQWLQFLGVIGQYPQLALSRELLRETAAKFEYINERMLDELTALAEKMIQVQARQAGRDQGGGATPQPGDGDSMGLLANILRGAAASGVPSG